MRRNFFLILLLVLLYAAESVFPGKKTNSSGSSRSAITEEAASSTPFAIPVTATQSGILVTRVIDGDTIEIQGGMKVRYIGINTPETVDPKKSVQCFGTESSKENKRLVEGKSVVLVKDISDMDRYGRMLRYVYADGVFVNEYLVRHGYARVSTFPPDVTFADRFLEAEREARKQNLGLWSGCGIP